MVPKNNVSYKKAYFVKMMTKGEVGSKISKNDDFFYECTLSKNSLSTHQIQIELCISLQIFYDIYGLEFGFLILSGL